MSDLTDGRFERIIDEVDALEAAKVRRVVFCSGKVYFDLLERRRAEKDDTVALVRIEELYPFRQRITRPSSIAIPARVISSGARRSPRTRAPGPDPPPAAAPLDEKRTLHYAGREGAAAPATGLFAMHQREQEALVAAALNRKTA